MKYLILGCILCSALCVGQNNLPDFSPSGGTQASGLFVNVNRGIATIGTSPTSIPSQKVAVSANATTYIYVDLSAGTVSTNTTGFTSSVYPIAIATTNGIQVVTLTDSRPGAYSVIGSGSGSVTSVTVAGTANQITATGTCVITSSGTCTLSIPNSPIFNTPSLGTTPLTTTYTNEGATGTTTNLLAKLTTANPSTIVLAATSDVSGIIGVCVSGCGTTSTSQIATRGQTSCVADASVTAGHYVTIGTNTAGRCGDSGAATFPTSGQVIGRWLANGTVGNPVNMHIFGPGDYGTPSGSTIVVASSPGIGIGHFGGSTQTLTSSLIVAGDITSGTITGTQLSTNLRIRGFGASFSGSSVANAQVAYGVIPYACTISAWNIMTDATAATFKVWKIATGTAIPTVSNNINTSGVSLSSNTAVHSTTVTDFTSTTVTANDMYAIVLSGVTGSPTFLNAFVECDQ